MYTGAFDHDVRYPVVPNSFSRKLFAYSFHSVCFYVVSGRHWFGDLSLLEDYAAIPVIEFLGFGAHGVALRFLHFSAEYAGIYPNPDLSGPLAVWNNGSKKSVFGRCRLHGDTSYAKTGHDPFSL